MRKERATNVSRKCEEHCTPTHLQWELAVLELEVGLYNVDPTTILNWLSTDQCLFAHQEVDVLEARGIVHKDGAEHLNELTGNSISSPTRRRGQDTGHGARQ